MKTFGLTLTYFTTRSDLVFKLLMGKIVRKSSNFKIFTRSGCQVYVYRVACPPVIIFTACYHLVQ